LSHNLAGRGATPRATSTLGLPEALADLWRALSREFVDPYHPERHYMRGRGPKWHAAHCRQCDGDDLLGD
jgi:hypothetical protein